MISPRGDGNTEMSDSTDDFELSDCQVEEIEKGLAKAHAGNFEAMREWQASSRSGLKGKGVYPRA